MDITNSITYTEIDITFRGKYLHNEKVKDCLKWRLDFVKQLTNLVDLIYDAICSQKKKPMEIISRATGLGRIHGILLKL